MEKIVIATIVKSKGLKGEVKAKLFTDDNLAKNLKQVFIEDKIFNVESSYISGEFWFVKFKEINNIDQAETLRNLDIQALRKELGDELLISDLVGKEVVLDNGVVVGILTDITELNNTNIQTLEIDDGLFLLPNTENLMVSVSDKIVLNESRFKELTEYDE